MKPMRILGLDLSLTGTGFAIFEVTNKKMLLIETGTITTTPKQTLPERLGRIHRVLDSVFKDYGFDYVIVENGFSRHNKTTQVLFRVRGVAELTAFLHGHKDLVGYAPLAIKKEVTGSGKADKQEVADAVCEILGFPQGFFGKKFDESDACAIVITFLRKNDYI